MTRKTKAGGTSPEERPGEDAGSFGEEPAARRKAEEELRESEARYRQLIDVSPDAIAIHADGTIVFVNPAAVALMGAESGAALLGKPVLEMVHPDFRETARGRIVEAPQTSRPAVPFREKFLRLDGTALDVEVMATPILHKGRPAMQVIARDITARKRAEEALWESEDKFKYVFDHSPTGKSITLPTGEIQANRALSDILGYTIKELNRLRWQEITHPDDIDITQKAVDRILSGESLALRFEKRYLRKDGSVVWADVGVVLRRDPAGRPLYFMTSVVDVTERRKAEEALRESEERFRAIFENGPIGMVLTSREFKFFSANPAFCRMLGYTAEEMRVRTFLDVTHPDHRQTDRENVEKLWRGEIPQYRTEKRYLTKGGEIRWGSLTASLIQRQDGKPICSLAVIEDITTRKIAEERNAEQLAELRRWHEVTAGRESRILELKGEVNRLLAESGRPARYASAASAEAGPEKGPSS